MPWKESDVRSERIAFVVRARQPGCKLAPLCREFGISRQTGYKWLRRFEEVGSLSALDEHSRRPHHSPHRTPWQIEQRLIELRLRYGWGGRKLSLWLAEEGIHLDGAAAVRGATLNVKINSSGLKDKETVEEYLRRAEEAVSQAESLEKEILEIVEEKL